MKKTESLDSSQQSEVSDTEKPKEIEEVEEVRQEAPNAKNTARADPTLYKRTRRNFTLTMVVPSSIVDNA